MFAVLVFQNKIGSSLIIQLFSFVLFGEVRNNSKEFILNEIREILRRHIATLQMLEAILDVILSRLADGASIDLIEDDGTILHVVTRHRNLPIQAKLEKYRKDHPLPVRASYGYPRVIRTGKSQFIPGVTARLYNRLYPDFTSETGEQLIPVRSYICVPLVSNGRTLGALTVKLTDQSRLFSRDDLLLFEEIAAIMAHFLDRESGNS